jgi:hypothetical protein
MSRRSAIAGAIISGAVVAAGAAASAGATHHAVPSAAGRSTLNCTTRRFAATIRRGPDAGRSFKGTLVFTVTPSGKVGGTLLARHKGSLRALPFTGSVSGRSFKLTFERPYGTITGVGTARHIIRRCKDIPRGGTLTGPHGDKGDWVTVVITICNSYLRACLVITITTS